MVGFHFTPHSLMVNASVVWLEHEGAPWCLTRADNVIACMKGLLDIVKYLLGKEGSVVSKRTIDGNLPVHLLCEASDGEAIMTED